MLGIQPLEAVDGLKTDTNSSSKYRGRFLFSRLMLFYKVTIRKIRRLTGMIVPKKDGVYRWMK